MIAVYEIMTWDIDCQGFTQQIGVPRLVKGQAGLRCGLRALRNIAYEARSGDPAVSVRRVMPPVTNEEYDRHDYPRGVVGTRQMLEDHIDRNDPMAAAKGCMSGCAIMFIAAVAVFLVWLLWRGIG